MNLRFRRFLFLLYFSLLFFVGLQAPAGIYKIQSNQLHIDGTAVPQLFGAEVQYFRLRGGYGPNVPREKVIKLWESALDRLVEANMNVISFYIPWDFHEYAPGKFDFDGTVDEDGDGNPDYPSRDVKTFFKMIEARGLHHIMVRPGPYINAEWGFLGFGAIPLWFHEKYPDSHMKNSNGQSTKLYDYHNEDLLRHTRLWFQKLYNDVLKDKIGAGKPISFLQLDNETNFMWQSLYNHDYGTGATKRYQKFLETKYKTIEALNKKHGQTWTHFQQVRGPAFPGVNVREDQDWYGFADESISTYLGEVRKIWEDIGVHEPEVLFTIADSYNATHNGLLPNYQLHNQKGITGLLTVNLYPKTYETTEKPLLNLPFKADHDVKAAESASEIYFGSGERWVMGPEIQAGWWRGIPVTSEARQHTYLTVLGHGMKALFVYYFNEGDNWQTDWAKKQIEPLFKKLHQDPLYREFSDSNLPEPFWQNLQTVVDQKLVTGFDVKSIMREDLGAAEKLYFDAPLAYGVVPSQHFYKLKELGEKLIKPYGDWLARAEEVTDPVCVLKDLQQNIPSYLAAIDNVEMNSTWSAGLIGYLLQGGINPKILHWGLNSDSEIENCKLILRQDTGETSPELAAKLKTLIEQGRSVVNFLDDSLAQKIGIKLNGTLKYAQGYFTDVKFKDQTFLARSAPLFSYPVVENTNCKSMLTHLDQSTGYQCTIGKGRFFQLGVLFYDVYNANEYGRQTDLPARAQILAGILADAEIKPSLKFETLASDPAFGKLVAFARKVKSLDPLWITVKSALATPTSQKLRVQGLEKTRLYSVQDLLAGSEILLKGEEIADNGIPVQVSAFGSTVYWVH